MLKLYDAAEYLDSPETIAAYITEALESANPSLITMAISAVGGRSSYLRTDALD
ncbi:hypothetical protein [Bradyrhizobium oligotrophicum]|uniref:hypothetical protein n=1 Tax=Bradyrhizobium oligotrophicum TaxID=44255 RepID=UPI003EB74601